VIFNLLLMVIYPIWIAPLFNKFQPLEDETLKERVQALMQRCGFAAEGLFVMDGSKRSAESNAYFTGLGKAKRVVFYDTLLARLSHDELEAVLAHEVSHIANGDMVTLTLIQGVVNTFVFFLARVIGQLIDRVVFKSESGQGVGYYVTVFVAEMVLGVLASIVVMWFSRQREFRADAGAASLASRGKMIAALEALQRAHHPSDLPSQVAAMGINGGIGDGLKRLFMTHPPLEERIEVLRSGL
jgi:heat shock protein HtpX